MTPSPLIPRAAVVAITFALIGFIGYAVYRGDYKSAVVLLFPVLFVLGADMGALIAAWRGQPTTPQVPPVDPPPAPPVLDGEKP